MKRLMSSLLGCLRRSAACRRRRYFWPRLPAPRWRPVRLEPLEQRALLAGLDYSTYLGGSTFDGANDVAHDALGNIYLVGATDSGNFPLTAGAFDISPNGGSDAFVVKFDSSGALLWATLLGGTDNEGASGVAVDSAGFVYVAGSTASADFPTTAGAFDTTYNGPGAPVPGIGHQGDAWVAKLDPNGSSLVYSA